MNDSEILIYQAADGKIRIDVRLEDETVWLTQDHMAGLFGKSKKTISEHIRNIFSEGELDEGVVVRNFRTTTRHGAMTDWIGRLDAIIRLNGRELLTHAGTITHQMALEKAALEYDKFRESQRRIQYEESLKELEEDIKKLTPPLEKGGES